jgi:hypothetical protein
VSMNARSSLNLSPRQRLLLARAGGDQRRLYPVPVPRLRRRPRWMRMLLGTLGYAAGGVLIAWVVFAGIDWFWRVLGWGWR